VAICPHHNTSFSIFGDLFEFLRMFLSTIVIPLISSNYLDENAFFATEFVVLIQWSSFEQKMFIFFSNGGESTNFQRRGGGYSLDQEDHDTREGDNGNHYVGLPRSSFTGHFFSSSKSKRLSAFSSSRVNSGIKGFKSTLTLRSSSYQVLNLVPV